MQVSPLPSILDELERWVNRDPQKLLFAFLDLGGRETERYTYQGLLERVDVIAGQLRAVHGFQTGDRLLLAYRPGLEIICAFFGCVRAGLIPVPVYPPSAQGFQSAVYRMAHIARDCSAAGILTNREYHTALENHMARNGNSEHSPEASYVANLRRICTEDMRESVSVERFPHSDLLFLQYTSGSTGRPRGVMVTHANILHNRSLVADHSSPIAVSWLPQYHDMGLIGYYLFAALSGATTYGFSPTDFIQRPALWLDSIKKYRASASSAPNFAFEYCLRPGRLSQETLENTDLSSLRFLMAAAEPVRPGTYERFLQKFQPLGLIPEHFYVAYGLAENTLAVSSYGRTVLSASKNGLALGRLRVTKEVSEIAGAKRLVSCGRPLGDVNVRIVDPEKHVALEDGSVGEIWVGGKSKCQGYWNNPQLTQSTFQAHIIGESQQEDAYLRTGDLGFLHEGELYVCGRTKDMIIVRGQNYYPHDIEHVVEDACDLVRNSCVVAFEINEEHVSALAVIAEVKSRRTIPDPHDVIAAIRNALNVEPAVVAFVAPKSVPKTSSGKVMRQQTRQMWMEGKFEVLGQFARGDLGHQDDTELDGPFQLLKTRYRLSGDETHTLVEAGVDSLDLVYFMHQVKELLKDKSAESLASEVDIRLIQQISVADLFRLAELFERSPESAIARVRKSLLEMQDEHRKRERRLMAEDRRLVFTPAARNGAGTHAARGGVLLTGGTGFLGPFLVKSLLEQTDDQVYILVRASQPAAGKERLWNAFQAIGDVAEEFRGRFEKRVTAVCGDLAKPSLDLAKDCWDFLAHQIQTIYHNGAAVNYLLNYEKMRAANVTGTNEVVRLAFEGAPKILNYISTTFIFGWATKEVLYESDCNDKMELLDFGYSQSKWVAEQVVFDAGRKGLTTRVFRPALVSPSVAGGGNNLDIAIRLLAFMVNHGIGVEAFNQVSFVPADVAADNVVAISNLPDTANSTFHVTRDEYASMVDVTHIITQLTGRQFELFKLPAFVPEVIRRCTRDDLLFPLLDFLIGSVASISSMEFKRYDSSLYQRARNASRYSQPDPSLEDTVHGILRFMSRKGIISIGVPAASHGRVLQGVARV